MGLCASVPRPAVELTAGAPDQRLADALAIAARADFSELSALGAGCRIELTEERAITLNQLQAVWAQIERRCAAEGWAGFKGDALESLKVSLYDVNKYIILPATAERRLSFVELIASGPQKPRFFVSHWWGEPVRAFIYCLAAHARDHKLDDHSTYWVCAYANNQWKLEEAVVEDPSQSSFNKAMNLAEGTVSILDEGGVVFTRVWCAFELYVSLMSSKPGYGWSVYTALEHDGRPHRIYKKRDEEYHAVGITEGDAPDDDMGPSGFLKRFREKAFPFSLMEAALKLRVETAQASVESDRVHILNRMITTDTAADLNAPPPAEHPRFEELNAMLQARFAAGGLRRAIEAGGEVKKSFFSALKQGRLRRLAVGFADCTVFSAEVAEELVAHLPQGLESLSLAHANDARVGAGEALVRALSEWLGSPNAADLTELSLDPLTGVPDELKKLLTDANSVRARPLDEIKFC